MTWKFDGDFKSDIVLYLKCLTGPQKSNFLFIDQFEYCFSFDLEIWWGFLIWYFTLPQMTHWTTKVQFLVYGPIWLVYVLLWLRNLMGIPNPILYFPSNDSLDHKSPISLFPYLWTDLNIIFSLTWKFNGDSKSDINCILSQMTHWTT